MTNPDNQLARTGLSRSKILSLRDTSDQWSEQLQFALPAYDAGTEVDSKLSNNRPASVPQEVMARLNGTLADNPDSIDGFVGENFLASVQPVRVR
ncbi:MAG: hypothetical protein WA888_09660 [Burkholderiaceae bacterium]